jgi:hypothetical protein
MTTFARFLHQAEKIAPEIILQAGSKVHFRGLARWESYTHEETITPYSETFTGGWGETCVEIQMANCCSGGQ